MRGRTTRAAGVDRPGTGRQDERRGSRARTRVADLTSVFDDASLAHDESNAAIVDPTRPTAGFRIASNLRPAPIGTARSAEASNPATSLHPNDRHTLHALDVLKTSPAVADRR
jgi:hypothetical protein